MSVIWKAKEVEILKQMLDANKTPQEVAQVLKSRTLDGIRNKVSKMGWKWTKNKSLMVTVFIEADAS